MNRRQFIAASCISCMGAGFVLPALPGCAVARSGQASISGSDMIVPLKEFVIKNGDRPTFKRYIIVHNEVLQYPICIYRFGENHYEALWMKCTHQGAELQAFGDKLQCPAHGSEFDDHGKVQNGPANEPLRTFPVTVSGSELKISLK